MTSSVEWLAAGLAVVLVLVVPPYAALIRQVRAVRSEQVAALARRVDQAEVDDLERRLTELETRWGLDQAKIQYLNERMTLLEDGIRVLTGQLRAAGLQPEWTPPAARPARQLPLDTGVVGPVLAAEFDLGELAALATSIGIDLENVKGETRETKARELASYAERRGLLAALVAAANAARPGRV